MYHVVIVEDELWIRNALVEMVEQCDGFRVVAVADCGTDGWDAVREHWPAVLITDIIMPERDGLWLVRQLSDHELPIVPIIISGHDEFTYAQEAMKYQVSEYLIKPVLEEDIVKALNNSLKRLYANQNNHEGFIMMQTYLDSMLNESSDHLLKGISSVCQHMLSIKTIPQRSRMSLLRMFSARITEQIKQVDSRFDSTAVFEENKDSIQNHFRNLIEAWIRCSHKGTGGQARNIIRHACDYIHANYMKDLAISAVAATANFSTPYFSTLFKKYTSETFVNYLNNVRITQTKKLLQEDELKIYEIAEMVGYTSLPYFHRIFKQLVGMSPNEYKRSLGLW